MDIAHRLAPPSARHWFGSDDFGRDVLTRCIYGARLSLTVGLLVVLVSLVCGTILGVVAGYVRRLDGLLMRVTDALMAFPDILLAIALMAALGASVYDVVIALGTVYTPRVARVARGGTLVLRELQFIEAAEALGATDRRVMLVHLLPNLLSPLLVQGTFIFAAAILTEAALSFLGAGVPPTNPDLGQHDRLRAAIHATGSVADPGARLLHRADRAVVADGRRRLARRARSPAASPDMTALAGRDATRRRAALGHRSAHAIPLRGPDRPRGGRRQLHAAPRRDVGHRRRIRQRQVGDLAVDHAPGAEPAGKNHRRQRDVPRTATCSACRTRDAQVRGNEIGMIFQEPMSSLNPLLTVGEQIAEVVRAHRGLGRAAADRHAIDMLARVQDPRSLRCARRNIRIASPAACASA